jgi:hypothetical protein
MVKVAQLSEVRRMIEAHSLFQRGIGLVDAPSDCLDLHYAAHRSLVTRQTSPRYCGDSRAQSEYPVTRVAHSSLRGL